MDFNTIIEIVGEENIAGIGGILIGMIFGFFAFRSQFCLRSAVIEVGDGKWGKKLAIWFICFSAALLFTQVFIVTGIFDVSSAKMISSSGSLSGALIGGILFGSGMILARGCSSRMLVLSASGNLRALLAGMVFAVVSQASLSGVLSPLRVAISSFLPLAPEWRDLRTLLHLGSYGGLIIAVICATYSVYFAKKIRLEFWGWFGAALVGITVSFAWLFNYQLSINSFVVIPVKSLSFSGPAAETLMYVLASTFGKWNFDLGLVPGVFVGSFIAAMISKSFKLEGFKDGISMLRSIAGAFMMGFGAMLAGGCAVGAGITGGSILSFTSWLTLMAMWASGVITHIVLDHEKILNN